MLGYTARWVRTIVQRWNREGEQAILDRRRLQKGAPPLLSPQQQQELDQALDQLLFLPSHSPELQPAEQLWPLSNEPLANRAFSSLDELEQVQAERCRFLQAHPELIRGRTAFHWWSASLSTTETGSI